MEKFNMFGALSIAAGTQRRIRHKNSPWYRYAQTPHDNRWSLQIKDAERRNGIDFFWPTIEQQQEKEWEIEPEGIVVWLLSPIPDHTFMYSVEPSKDDNGSWFTDGRILVDRAVDLPENKPRKYKLVPIKD